MLTYSFERNSKSPLYEQLYDFIKSDIISGKIKGGDKLPSKREFAAHLGISKVTVEAAYSALISEGYVYSLEKRGYYCEKNLALPEKKASALPAKKEEGKKYDIDLSSNAVPGTQFPFSVWSRLMREITLNYSRELLDPIPFEGARILRSALSAYLMSERGMNIPADRIFIGAGSEYLYTQIIRLLGSDNIYGIENPSYHKISKVYSMNGAHIRQIDITGESLNAEKLESAGIDILHISPSHNFPTGAVMGAKERHEILSWADKKAGRYVIEDDFDSELRFEGKPIPPMQTIDSAGKVIYINTCSKTISPALRIGYMVLPGELAERYRRTLSFNSCTVSSFEQYALADFISRGYFERHLSRTKKYYRILREKLLDVYENSKISSSSELCESQAGLHFTLKLRTALPDETIKARLATAGIKAAFMSDYCSAPLGRPHELLINYSGLDEEKFSRALTAIYEIIC
ncbi:MAG: PLP-dependent aminotransferase family protein [Clostridia bacterium]|nr:PLP-dependent aminotransferase family protein [Clostridia bacterium]